MNPQSKQEETNQTTSSNILQKDVYTSEGTYVGKVKDVYLDFDKDEVTDVVLERVNNSLVKIPSGKKGVTIPYRWVKSIDDVVIIADFKESND